MAIIIVSPGQKAQRVEQQSVGREDYLQEYLRANPETLPVEELKPGAKLLVISREFPTDSGPIDALAIDNDGDIYIVETKLAKNPDKRRVIAQMLDYGAALWNAGAESFFASAKGTVLLGEQIASAFSLTEEEDVTAVIRNLRSNVDAGRFQFVVLMNQIDERLRTLITFVNSSSRFRILGLELDFYRHGDLDILIPRLYGTETRSLDAIDSTGRGRKWTESDFFKEVAEQLAPAETARLRELHDWAARTGEIRWSTTIGLGGFNVAFPRVSTNRLFKVDSAGQLVFMLSELGEIGVRIRQEMQAAGFQIPEGTKQWIVPASEWTGRFDALVAAITRVATP